MRTTRLCIFTLQLASTIVGLWDLGCEGRLRSADAGPYSAGGSAGGKYKELIEEVFSIFLTEPESYFEWNQH